MLVKFLENKGFCEKDQVTELPDSKAQGLIGRGLVKEVKGVGQKTPSKTEGKTSKFKKKSTKEGED